MAVDLGDLVEYVRAATSPPGTDLFPNATDDNWTDALRDAFWTARLEGFTALSNYVEADGSITPITGSTDLSRDVQQIIVFVAGITAVRNDLRNIKTSFRAQAGPVEYETQQSAQVLRGILDDLVKERNILLLRLSDVGAVPTSYIDGLAAREDSIRYGDTQYASGGSGQYSW